MQEMSGFSHAAPPLGGSRWIRSAPVVSTRGADRVQFVLTDLRSGNNLLSKDRAAQVRQRFECAPR